jgi:hypothetical protein
LKFEKIASPPEAVKCFMYLQGWQNMLQYYTKPYTKFFNTVFREVNSYEARYNKRKQVFLQSDLFLSGF